MSQPSATSPGFRASRGLRASGDGGCFGPAGTIGCVAIIRFSGAGAREYRLVTRVSVRVSSRLHGLAKRLIGPWRFPRPGRPEPPDIPRCSRLRVRWGRIQRSAQSCQRGAALSDGESWSAGQAMVFQHPSASAGFPEGIQFDGPLVSSPVAPELPESGPSRKADRSAARQQATPRPACPDCQAFRTMAESST